MKKISILIKPSSSLCNMKCKYCFYYDVASHREIPSYGIMNECVMETLIIKSLKLGDTANITYAFQGGEPTLAGLEFYKKFVDYVAYNKTNQKIRYIIQTNGLLVTDEWIQFFKKNNFLIGISLDGYKDLHNYYRIDHDSNKTFQKVMNTISLLKKGDVDFNILCVLTKGMAKHPEKIFNFILKNSFKYVQFIPCLPGLDEKETQYSLTPQMFYQFYKVIFTMWLDEYKKGNYISITLFDNLIPLFRGIPPQQCGMLGSCAPQLVIESNGDVYPCDFYVLDQYKCGNILNDEFVDILKSQKMKTFIEESRRECDECKDCNYVSICHKNCKRQNVTYYSKEYCGYRCLLQYGEIEMLKIASQL